MNRDDVIRMAREAAEAIDVIRGIMKFIRTHGEDVRGFDPDLAERRVNARLDQLAAFLASSTAQPQQGEQRSMCAKCGQHHPNPSCKHMTPSDFSKLSGQKRFDRSTFNAAAWVEQLTKAVTVRGVTWAQLSEETGVSTTTLSRVRSGERQPDAAALAVLSAWAGINPAKYCDAVQPQRGEAVVITNGAWRHIEADTICDLIEKHRAYCSKDTETFKDEALHQLLRDVVDAAAAAIRQRGSAD